MTYHICQWRFATFGRKPRKFGNKILSAENLITEQLQLRLFVVIDTDEDHAILGHETSCNLQTLLHERQPLGVAEGICLIDIRIVVDEVLIAGVVRRVYVDEVNLPAMRFLQELKRGEVVAFDEEV